MDIPEGIKELVVLWINRKYDKGSELLTKSMGGGSINNTAMISLGQHNFFIKWNSADLYPKMFNKEAKGLKLLRRAKAIDVPRPLYVDAADGVSFLLMEYKESAVPKNNFWEKFAMALAKLHQHYHNRFGLNHDNYIGSLVQSNSYHDDWNTFFIQERLLPQLKSAHDQRGLTEMTVKGFDSLFKRLPEIFPNERPSLVHGDLWSGNFIVNKKGEACIIDPAVYYGNREMDIAMTRLFGGFSSIFYETYNEYFPLEKGWEHRMDICNLYPLLVHVNLFGGSYSMQVRDIIRKYI